jgi:hypothetical protein
MAWQFYFVLQTVVALVCLRIAVSLVAELNVQNQSDASEPQKKRLHIHPVVENVITGVLAGFGVETWMAFGRYMTDNGSDDAPGGAPHANLSLVLFYAMTFLLALVIWFAYVWHKSLAPVAVGRSPSATATGHSDRNAHRAADDSDQRGDRKTIAETGLAVGVTALVCAFGFYAIGPIHRALD